MMTRKDLAKEFRAAEKAGNRAEMDRLARTILVHDARKGNPSARFMCRAKGWDF